MASASAGLLFIYGIGSMGGPIITGWMMGIIEPDGYWVYMGVLLALLTAYAGWRTTQRRALTPDEQGSFAVITPNATPTAVDAVLEEAQSDDPSPQPAT